MTAPDATHDNLGPQPRGQRIFYRSDHYNFAKMGIPIAFFTVGLHVDYHRPTDTPEKIDYHEIQTVSKTVAAVGWELANRARPPEAERETAGRSGQGYEDREGRGLGQDHAGAAAAAWGAVLRNRAPVRADTSRGISGLAPDAGLVWRLVAANSMSSCVANRRFPGCGR